MSDHWDQVDALFSEVAELPLDQRAAILAACPNDAVRAEVIGLLAHADPATLHDPIAGAIQYAAQMLDPAQALILNPAVRSGVEGHNPGRDQGEPAKILKDPFHDAGPVDPFS